MLSGFLCEWVIKASEILLKSVVNGVEERFVLIQIWGELIDLLEGGNVVRVVHLSVDHPLFIPELPFLLWFGDAKGRGGQVIQILFNLKNLFGAVVLEEVLVGGVKDLQAVAIGHIHLYELLQIGDELLSILRNVRLD